MWPKMLRLGSNTSCCKWSMPDCLAHRTCYKSSAKGTHYVVRRSSTASDPLGEARAISKQGYSDVTDFAFWYICWVCMTQVLPCQSTLCMTPQRKQDACLQVCLVLWVGGRVPSRLHCSFDLVICHRRLIQLVALSKPGWQAAVQHCYTAITTAAKC